MGGHVLVPCGIIPSQGLVALPDDIVEHGVGGDAGALRQDGDALLEAALLVQGVAVVIQVAEVPPHGRIQRGQFLQGLVIQPHPRPLPRGLPRRDGLPPLPAPVLQGDLPGNQPCRHRQDHRRGSGTPEPAGHYPLPGDRRTDPVSRDSPCGKQDHGDGRGPPHAERIGEEREHGHRHEAVPERAAPPHKPRHRRRQGRKAQRQSRHARLHPHLQVLVEGVLRTPRDPDYGSGAFSLAEIPLLCPAVRPQGSPRPGPAQRGRGYRPDLHVPYMQPPGGGVPLQHERPRAQQHGCHGPCRRHRPVPAHPLSGAGLPEQADGERHRQGEPSRTAHRGGEDRHREHGRDRRGTEGEQAHEHPPEIQAAQGPAPSRGQEGAQDRPAQKPPHGPVPHEIPQGDRARHSDEPAVGPRVGEAPCHAEQRMPGRGVPEHLGQALHALGGTPHAQGAEHRRMRHPPAGAEEHLGAEIQGHIGERPLYGHHGHRLPAACPGYEVKDAQHPEQQVGQAPEGPAVFQTGSIQWNTMFLRRKYNTFQRSGIP